MSQSVTIFRHLQVLLVISSFFHQNKLEVPPSGACAEKFLKMRSQLLLTFLFVILACPSFSNMSQMIPTQAYEKLIRLTLLKFCRGGWRLQMRISFHFHCNKEEEETLLFPTFRTILNFSIYLAKCLMLGKNLYGTL